MPLTRYQGSKHKIIMNKFIIPIIIVVILAVGIGAFFVWQKSAFSESQNKQGMNNSKILENHQVWFIPAPMSADMLRLFTEPNKWVQDRSKIDVYGFYSQQILGGFTLEQRANAGFSEREEALPFVISKLKEWGKEIAIEVASSPSAMRFKGIADGVEGEKKYRETGVAECKTRAQAVNDYAAMSKDAIKRVSSLGGTVRYLVMDELLHYWYPYPVILDEKPAPCRHNNISEMAKDAAKYIKQVQIAYPSVLIGDMEPYPIQSVENMKTWIIELEKNGIKLEFFHLDVEGWVYKRPSEQVTRELQELRSFFKSRDISFGVIYTDNTWDSIEKWEGGKLIYKQDYSDKEYYENTIKWIRIVKNAIGELDHYIFQSWREAYGDKHKKIPYNLPEDDLYSHTHLINKGLEIYGDLRALIVPKPQKPALAEPQNKKGGKITVKQSGGAAMPIHECGDKSYITNTADYIIEGTVEKVESKWNEEKTSIFTYIDLRIENYVKGAQFTENKLQIVTPGGTVGEITQAVEDQPIFHKGKKARVYFQKTDGEFSIICAQFGVEEM